MLSPLPFDSAVNLSGAELAAHRIKSDGYSDLPCYADSIFSINFIHGSTIYRGSESAIRLPDHYVIVRYHTEDVETPLETAVCLDYRKVVALQIKSDGTSARPDLQGYKFTAIPTSQDYSSYIVTKHKL